MPLPKKKSKGAYLSFNIAFCADEAYIKFAAAMINNIVLKTNLKLSHKKDPYIFHILSDKIGELNLKKLAQLELELSKIYPIKINTHILDCDEFEVSYKGSYVSNLILKIGSVLKDEKRVLCLDLDMFVLCDLREIFSIDLKDKVLAAAKNHTNFGKWFNTGFLYINLSLWRERNLEQKTIEYINTHKPDLPDQSAINFCTKDQVMILPMLYNFYPHNKYYSKSFFDDNLHINEASHNLLLRSAKIIHFLQGPKPWHSAFLKSYKNQLCISIFRQPWWNFALKTPAFDKELRAIYNVLKNRECEDLALYTSIELESIWDNFQNNKVLAIQRFKNSLEYRLGFALIRASKSPFKYTFLIFTFLKIYLSAKIENKIYELISRHNPRLKLEKLEKCDDYIDVINAKRHLSYRFGLCIVKNFKTWYKGGLFRLYFELKKIEKEF